MKTDTQLKIEALKNSDKEGAYAKTDGIEKETYCCGKMRTPMAIISFPNDEFRYFVCPKCESF